MGRFHNQTIPDPGPYGKNMAFPLSGLDASMDPPALLCWSYADHASLASWIQNTKHNKLVAIFWIERKIIEQSRYWMPFFTHLQIFCQIEARQRFLSYKKRLNFNPTWLSLQWFNWSFKWLITFSLICWIWRYMICCASHSQFRERAFRK